MTNMNLSKFLGAVSIVMAIVFIFLGKIEYSIFCIAYSLWLSVIAFFFKSKTKGDQS